MISRILERLEETRWTTIFDTQCVLENAKLDKCIEIVQDVAKEYDWIPVEQKSPEDFTDVYITCISLIDDRKPWVVEGVYNSTTGWKGMSPMLDLGKAKVTAWMLKKCPAPYQKGE